MSRDYITKNKKTARKAAENDVRMLRRLAQSYDDDYGFADILDRFSRHEFSHIGTIPVCKTPNVLALGGADTSLDVIINPKTILKCMSRPQERYHGHDLDKDVFKYLIFELRNPVMLLKGSKEGTLVAVTDLIDRQGRPIIVSIALNRKNAWHLANQITSAYGRNDFNGYLKRQIENGNLIAFNKNKANQMFHSAGVQFPMEETLISFDNSIAYSFENVKRISVENYREFDDKDVKDASLRDGYEGTVDSIIADAKGRSRHSENCYDREFSELEL